MKQAKFSLNSSQLKFLEQAQSHGFKDKSQVVRIALDRMMRDMKEQQLRQSAKLYAETLDEDSETKEWLEVAAEEWPDE